jgi:hypothetical protein
VPILDIARLGYDRRESSDSEDCFMAHVPSEYATNTVACKLWSLVNDESPIEFILGWALFHELSNLYPEWRCWIYSRSDFLASSQLAQGRLERGRVFCQCSNRCRTVCCVIFF